MRLLGWHSSFMILLPQEVAAQDALRIRLEAEVDMCQELLQVRLHDVCFLAGRGRSCEHSCACCFGADSMYSMHCGRNAAMSP